MTTERRRARGTGLLVGVLAGTRWAVGTALVLVALVLSAVRLALPQLDKHPDRVAAVVSGALGHPVRFARLSTAMSGVTPQLELSEATLTGADGSVTRIGTLRLWLDWTASLLAREPRLSALEIDGLRIAVLRQPDGRWRIAGMSVSNDNDPGGFSAWLLAQPQVRLRAAVIDIADSTEPARVLRLEPASADLQRRGDTHWLDLRVGVAGAASGSFRLRARIESLQDELAASAGNAYFTARNLTGADVPVGRLLFGGQLDGEAWLRWQAGRIERVHGSLDGQARLQTAAGDAVVDLDSLQLSGVFQRAGDDWSVGIDHLRAAAGDRSWRIEHGFVHRRADGVAARAESVDLAGLGPLLALAAAQDGRAARVAGADPTLRARQVAATLDAAASLASLGLAAQVDELSWQADGALPGLAGLAGELRIGASAASFELLGAPHLTLTAPRLYAAPRMLDVARGVVTAQWSAAGVEVQVQDLATRSGSIDLAARARLSLPAQGEPHVFVQASTPQAPAAEFFALLPDASLSPKFIEWGHDAIKAGTLVDVQALLRGDPRRFPFRDHQGAFAATTDFVDVALDYQPGAGWPAVTEGRGRFSLDGPQFSLTLDGGRLLDSRARDVAVRIPDIGLKSKRLLLDGVASGPAQDVIRFIQESPLASRFGRQVERLRFEGGAETDVALDLVFTGPDKSTRVSGTTHLRGNTLGIDGTGLVVSALQGDVGFGSGGLDARAVKAQLFGGPVTFDLRSVPGRSLRIEPRGEAAAADLVRYLRLPWPELFAGPLPWQGGIDIAGDGGLALDLNLELDRATRDLPPPLDALHREPMAVRARCDCGGARGWDVTLAAQDLTARLDLMPVAGGGTVLRRGDLAIGVETRLPSAGFNVHGRVPDLALAPWLAWLTTYFGRGGAGDWPPPRVDIYADRLVYLGQTFPGTRLQVVRGDGWDVSVDAPGVAGAITISGSEADQRVQLDLARLHFARQPPGGKGTDEPGVNPAAIPALAGRVGELRLDGENFGALEFSSVRRADGLDFDSVSLRGDYGQIGGRGSWRGSAASNETRLTAKADFSDFGAFLGHFGVRELVRGGNGKLAADLGWPGSPGAFDFPALIGTVGGDLRRGTLPDVEPGVGRLFGILSLDNVIRRLSLDFRDVFGRGFAVDRMRGDIDLTAGQAQLKNLRVRGPAANLTLNGGTNLKDRSLDVDVLAVPQVTSTLPLAGAIAAPPVGAAIYLGQKMIGGTIDKVAEQRYHVTGTWAEPKIDKR